MLLHRNRLVVMGGVHDEDTPDGDGLVSEFYDDIHTYALDTGKWRAITVERRNLKTLAGGGVEAGGGGDGDGVEDGEGGWDGDVDTAGGDLVLALGGGRRRNRNKNDSDDDDPAPPPAQERVPLTEGAPGGDDAPLAPVPCPRMNHRMALKGNMMYVYGGLFEPEESVRGRFFFNGPGLVGTRMSEPDDFYSSRPGLLGGRGC
jgi:hypothetical protein